MRYGRSRFGCPARAEPLLANPVPLPARRRALVPASRLTNARHAGGRGARTGAVAVAPITRRAEPHLRATPRADVEPKGDGRPARRSGLDTSGPRNDTDCGSPQQSPAATRRGLPMAVGGPHLSSETGRPPYPPATTETRATSREDYENQGERTGDRLTSPELRGKMPPLTLPRVRGDRPRRWPVP